MRTIQFNDEDIKECKLALVNQNLTSLQSAFLAQHITNIENENIILNRNINNTIEFLNSLVELDGTLTTKGITKVIARLKGANNDNN